MIGKVERAIEMDKGMEMPSLELMITCLSTGNSAPFGAALKLRAHWGLAASRGTHTVVCSTVRSAPKSLGHVLFNGLSMAHMGRLHGGGWRCRRDTGHYCIDFHRELPVSGWLHEWPPAQTVQCKTRPN